MFGSMKWYLYVHKPSHGSQGNDNGKSYVREDNGRGLIATWRYVIILINEEILFN